MDKEVIIDKIVARLIEIFGKDKTQEVLDQMRYEGAILSGSFILQCIYDERWKGSDLDFYVPYIEDGKCCGINHNCPVEKVCVRDTVFDISDMAMRYSFHNYIARLDMVISEDFYPVSVTSDTYGNLPIKTVRTFSHREYRTPYRVQVIQCDEPLMRVAEFDFDILKNVFGVNADGTYFLYIKSWNDIEERLTNFYFTDNNDRTIMRAKKYISRGISFRGNPYFLYEQQPLRYPYKKMDFPISKHSISDVFSTYREIIKVVGPSWESLPLKAKLQNQEYIEKYVNKPLDEGPIPIAAILTEHMRLAHVNDRVRYGSMTRWDEDDEDISLPLINYTYFDNGLKFQPKDIAKVKTAVLKLEAKYLDLKYDLRSNIGRKFISWIST